MKYEQQPDKLDLLWSRFDNLINSNHIDSSEFKTILDNLVKELKSQGVKDAEKTVMYELRMAIADNIATNKSNTAVEELIKGLGEDGEFYNPQLKAVVVERLFNATADNQTQEIKRLKGCLIDKFKVKPDKINQELDSYKKIRINELQEQLRVLTTTPALNKLAIQEAVEEMKRLGFTPKQESSKSSSPSQKLNEDNFQVSQTEPRKGERGFGVLLTDMVRQRIEENTINPLEKRHLEEQRRAESERTESAQHQVADIITQIFYDEFGESEISSLNGLNDAINDSQSLALILNLLDKNRFKDLLADSVFLNARGEAVRRHNVGEIASQKKADRLKKDALTVQQVKLIFNQMFRDEISEDEAYQQAGDIIKQNLGRELIDNDPIISRAIALAKNPQRKAFLNQVVIPENNTPGWYDQLISKIVKINKLPMSDDLKRQFAKVAISKAYWENEGADADQKSLKKIIEDVKKALTS